MAERQRIPLRQQRQVERSRFESLTEDFSPERDSEFAGEFAVNSRYIRRNLNGRDPQDEARRIEEWKPTF